MKTFQDFLHIIDFNGNQTVQGPKDNFSARILTHIEHLRYCTFFLHPSEYLSNTLATELICRQQNRMP